LQARKEKTLALGLYPERSLAEARDQRDEARKLVRNDIDPGEERKREKRDQKVRSVNTFRLLANEWHQAQLANGRPVTPRASRAVSKSISSHH
jgi:Arm DNA-binding domain